MSIHHNTAIAAVNTLESLGYTYNEGAELWTPPEGENQPEGFLSGIEAAAKAVEWKYNHATVVDGQDVIIWAHDEIRALAAKENEQCQVSTGPVTGAAINGLHGSDAGAPAAVANSYTDEVDRLRAALKRIVLGKYDGLEVDHHTASECRQIARAVLSKTPTTKS